MEVWNGRINHHLFINGQCNRTAVNSHFYFCQTDLTRGKGKLKMGKFEFYVLSSWCNSRLWCRTYDNFISDQNFWNMYKRTVVLQVDNLSLPENLSSSKQPIFGQSICLLISVTGLSCSLQPRYLAIQFILITVKVCHSWIIANKVLSAIRTMTEMQLVADLVLNQLKKKKPLRICLRRIRPIVHSESKRHPKADQLNSKTLR